MAQHARARSAERVVGLEGKKEGFVEAKARPPQGTEA